MGKTLLYLGGSALQLAGLRWAREAGLDVILTDARPDVPGRAVANGFHQVRGDDVEELVRIARSIAHETELAGAYCSNDFGLAAVGAIGAATGTPAAAPDAIARALDKETACSTWHTEAVPTPRGRLVESEDDLVRAIDDLGLPAIVKPVGSSGSRGVRSIWNHAEADDALRVARAEGGQVRVESYVHGHHVDVNGFFANGTFVRGGMLDRFFAEPPHHNPIWGCQPSLLDDAAENAVYEVVERGARALGIDVGPVKADVVIGADEPVLLELTPRFHGDVSTAHVSPLATDKSPIQDWFRYLADPAGFVPPQPATTQRFGGWMAIFPDRPGVLEEIRGIDRVTLNGVTGAMVHKRAGQRIERIGDNTAVCGFLWTTGRDRSEVEARLRDARAEIEVIVA